MKDLVLIVPVHNEELIIKESIKKLDNYLKRLGIDYLIVIADNASSDNTPRIARKLQTRNIKYVRIERKGKGYAIIYASRLFKARMYGFIDVDLPTDLRNIERAINKLKSHDLVVGYRKELIASTTRKIISKGYKLLGNLILFNKLRVKDFQAGFKFWNEKVNKLIDESLDQEWFFDTTLIYRVSKNELSIYYLPIRYRIDRASGKNKLKVVNQSIEFLFKLIDLKLKQYRYAPLLMVVIATLLSSSGNVLFKQFTMHGLNITGIIYLSLGMALLFTGFLFFYIALRIGELSRVHPSMALNFLWTNLFALLLLHEAFPIKKIISILIIIIGVILLNR